MAKKTVRGKVSTKKAVSARKTVDSPFYKKWWFWATVVFLVLGGISSIRKSSERMPLEEPSSPKDEPEEYVLTRFDLESDCQDLAMKLTNGDVIKIIDAWGNGGFFEEHAGGYDSDGNPIGLVTWYGKNKVLNKSVRFSCWGSGSSKDNISIYSLSMNGEQLYGSLDFPSYNQDGEPIEKN